MKDDRYKVPVSVQLILKKDNDVLLLRRYNTGFADGHYALPAGHVEDNEEIVEAMIRETKEEIGVTVKKEDLKFEHVLYRKAKGITYVDFIFSSTRWDGIVKIMEPNKCDEVQWFNNNDLPEKTIPFTRKLLETRDQLYIPYGWTEEEQLLDKLQNMNSDT